MMRLARLILLLVFALLCSATAFLWARSHSISDRVSYVRDLPSGNGPTEQVFDLASIRDTLYFGKASAPATVNGAGSHWAWTTFSPLNRMPIAKTGSQTLGFHFSSAVGPDGRPILSLSAPHAFLILLFLLPCLLLSSAERRSLRKKRLARAANPITSQFFS